MSIGEAHHELVIAELPADVRRALTDTQKQMWAMTNRIGVRRGPKDAAYVAADVFIDAGSELLTIIFEAAEEGETASASAPIANGGLRRRRHRSSIWPAAAQVLAAQPEGAVPSPAGAPKRWPRDAPTSGAVAAAPR
jgi:hypothetical protein